LPCSKPTNGLHDSAVFDVGKPSAGSVTLSLRLEDASRALGVSDETFTRYVRPSLPVVRLGSVRVYPVALLEAWLCEHADRPIDELGRAA
jgi:hypothetical protein